MKTWRVALAAGVVLGAGLFAASMYQGTRIIDARSDWHRYGCVRTATVLRVPTFELIPGGHGKGYNEQYSHVQDWRLDAAAQPLRFVRDRAGACRAQLEGAMTAEQRASGLRPPQFDAAGNFVVPEARFTVMPDFIERRRVDVCWNRPDGTTQRCKAFALDAHGALDGAASAVTR